MKLRSNETRRARPLLGTFVEIAVAGSREHERHFAIDAAFGIIEKAQRALSFHDPDSTLSRINRRAAHAPVQADEWTFAVLRAAAEIHRVSRGLFDIAIAPHLQRRGFLPNESRLSPSEPMDATFADVELQPDRFVRFRNPNVRLDLGGIGKGFAIDLAIAELRSHGITRGLVNAGGDLRAFGTPGFCVAVRHPENPGASFPPFCLTNAALATSAHYFSDRLVARSKTAPIVNVRTGRFATGVRSATVRASNAMLADALTKIVMVAGEKALDVLNHFQADAFFIARNGSALCSSHWHDTFDLSS